MVIETAQLAIPLRLSAEQRAWLQMSGGEARAGAAVHCVSVELGAVVPVERVRRALAQVIDAHSILRTAVVQVPGMRGLHLQPLQDAFPVSVHLIDSAELRSAPLDISRGEVLRAALVRRDASTRLVIVASILAVDSRSLRLLAGSIMRACGGDEVEFPALQYTQYIEWREEVAAGEEASAGADYWHGCFDELRGADAPQLVYRRAGTRVLGAPRLYAARRFEGERIEQLNDLADAAGVQKEILLQAVWWALIARLTGFRRCAVGWQHDCRDDYDLMQGTIGVFEKILPLLVETEGDEPFSSWLARVCAGASRHIEHQEHCPIDQSTASAHLAVGFACHRSQPPVGSVPWRVVERPGPMPCFELALQTELAESSAELELHADAALYEQGSIDALLAQYVTMLEAVLDQPDRALAKLRWIDEAQRVSLPAWWQGPLLDLGDESIEQRVTHWARANPDAPALATNTQTLSYAKLDAECNRVAQWMRRQGVTAGALVALALPRSPEAIIAMLAAWRCGAGYLPLDPQWPAARLQRILEDARPALLLGCERGVHAGPWQAAVLSEIDLDEFAATPPPSAAAADSVAYVLYTSGSTGEPKGVVIEQRQLLNYVAAASNAMDLSACRRWGLVSSLAADLGNTALFGALYHGACLAIADEEEAKSASAFARFMARHEVDALKIVPSHLDALLEGASQPLLRTLVLGGETASRALLERLERDAPGCSVFNHYGPTETTVGVMVHRVERAAPLPEVLPLSRVLANNCIRVLDDELQPVPIGALGEVYVGGAQVCRGYLDRELHDAFVPDPWDPARRLYRTGDLAWVLPEGAVRLAGRRDHQVKIRGFRVEPGEIEAALLSLPGIRHAAVIVRGIDAAKELIAFVVPQANEPADASQLAAWRSTLAQLLPEPMRPSSIALVNALPRLPNGKLDRHALASQHTGGAQVYAGAAPRSALEALVAGFMAGVLEREGVPADADFLELGGHSLLVIRLAARLGKVLGIEVHPGFVFEHPTAQALAAALSLRHDAATLERLAEEHAASA